MVRRRPTKAGDLAPIVIADGEGTRTVAMRWGFAPADNKGRSRFLVRDDSAEIDRYARCLIPATALPLTDPDGTDWLVTLNDAQALICFAGVWQEASDDWPRSYAAVTVPAYPDLKFIKPRHIAILPRAAWAQWLEGAPASGILKSWPRRSLKVVPQ